MYHQNRSILARLEAFGLTNVVVVGLGALYLIYLVPHFLHARSALQVPANPNMSVAEYNRRGNELYERNLFKRAAVEYGHMIEKAPDNPDGYLFRGMAQVKQGDYKDAIRNDTEGLLHAHASDMRSCLLYNRGLAARDMGAFQKAIPDFSEAISLMPDNWDAYEIRAFCYTEVGNYDGAISDYTVAIGQNPHPGTVFERGQAYLKKKEYAKAVADFNRSLTDRPDFPVGYQLRADAYVGLKEYDRAVTDAQTLLRMNNTAANRGALGWYDYLAGKLPESITNSQMAVKMDPNTTFARFNIGLCYAVQGNAEAAQAAYQDALPHAKAADLKGGIQDLKEAQKQQPNSPVLKQAETLLENALPQGAGKS